MKSLVNHFNNLLMPLIPESHFWGLKRAMLRLAGAKVGRNVKVSSSLKIYGCGELAIGDNTWIGYQAMIVSSSRVEIGTNVDIAPRVYIGTGTHTIDTSSDHVAATDISKDVTIGDGCWICVNATLLPGVSLGEKCVVGAGAVVTKPFDENKILIGGVPARKIKDL